MPWRPVVVALNIFLHKQCTECSKWVPGSLTLTSGHFYFVKGLFQRVLHITPKTIWPTQHDPGSGSVIHGHQEDWMKSMCTSFWEECTLKTKPVHISYFLFDVTWPNMDISPNYSSPVPGKNFSVYRGWAEAHHTGAAKSPKLYWADFMHLWSACIIQLAVVTKNRYLGFV